MGLTGALRLRDLRHWMGSTIIAGRMTDSAMGCGNQGQGQSGGVGRAIA